MLFAKTDMLDAAIALKDKDIEESIDAQSFVADSLNGILDQLRVLSPQYVYVNELNESLRESLLEGMIIRNEKNPDKVKKEAYALKLYKTAGWENYGTSPDDIRRLTNVMELLSNLQDEVTWVPEVPPGHIMTLDLLAYVTEQKILYRKTQSANSKELKGLAASHFKWIKRGELLSFPKRLQALANDAKEKDEKALLGWIKRFSHLKDIDTQTLKNTAAFELKVSNRVKKNTELSLKFSTIKKLMLEASANLKSGSLKDAANKQNQAREILRHVFITCVRDFVGFYGPPPPSDVIVPPEVSEEDLFELMESGIVKLIPRKDGRLEWEVLGRRKRAALNENFARELPLEYRGILKDYYERLAR